MGFIMDGLDAEAYDRQYTDRALIARITRYFRPQAGRMLLITILMILGSLTFLVFPLLVSSGLDRLMASRTAQTVTTFVVIIFVAGVLSWIFHSLSQRIT